MPPTCNLLLQQQYPLVLQDVGGGEFTYQYNAFGQVTRIVDSEGGEQRFDYDAIGRLVFHNFRASIRF